MRHRALPVLRGLLTPVLVLALVAVSGCAKKPEPLVALPPPSTLDLVAQHGELRVCSTGDSRPFTFRDPANGRWSGTDVDLAGDLAGRLGVRLTLVPTTWTTMLDDLGGGHCDIVMSGVPITLDRALRAAYSQPYLTDGKTPITRCADVARFQTLDQIDRPGVRAAVSPGGTNESFAKERLRKAKLISFPNSTASVQEILAGRADVMITDVSEARNQAKQHPGQLCAVNPDRPLSAGQKAYLLPRGDTVFQQYVDTWLRIAQADGTFLRINRPLTG
ncbi:MAG: transporter substrate-binding domain-containing protein [Actinomycetota bacterium]|nr:transporter substrate-binding domain-containing protein [Actinomycetota bacterium]